MNILDLKTFCLSFKGAKESMPFDNKILVFSVKEKMFCATNINDFKFINIKFKPEDAIYVREKYENVLPGHYMNKKYWNSVEMNNKIPQNIIEDWIRDSYKIVVSSLPKKTQNEL